MASRDPCEAGVAVHLGLRSQADLHEKLWTAVRHGGCDGFLEIPKTRFDVDLYVDYEDQQRAMSSFKSYCRHQGELLGAGRFVAECGAARTAPGHIEGIEIFDASFFNIAEPDSGG